MVACFHLGAVALPCNEQLRAQGPAPAARRRATEADRRRRAQPRRARGRRPGLPRAPHPGPGGLHAAPATPPPYAELEPTDPCLITFTSGTTGEAKGIVHGQRYLPGQRAAGRALARRPAGRARVVHGGQRLVEVGAQRVHRPLAARGAPRCCTTRASTRASGWRSWSASRSAILCMAPTEYRVIAKRAEPPRRLAAARDGRRRRGAQPRGAACVRGGHRAADPRRLRPDRDRPAHRHTARPAGAPGVDGPPAAGGRARGDRRRARAARPAQRPDVLRRLPRRRAGARGRAPGAPATGSATTRTATCTSRGAPTT